MRTADLVVVGFGNVARRFVELLDERAQRLSGDYDVVCRLAGQATRTRGAFFGEERCADVFALIERLSRSTADFRIVIETTTLNVQDGEPAISHVRAAIASGCHVVTANKGPVAFAYSQLREEAARAGVRFLFEGAVMDGVPVFNMFRDALPAVTIAGFEGVINTTTNHIITAMENGDTFQHALGKMQAEGIAEADPSLDVDGWDAAAKTAALANVLMEARITPHDVHRQGIDATTGELARAARAHGRRLKLVASARRDSAGALHCEVRPRELPQDTLLAGLGGEANALIVETDVLNRIAICQLSSSLTQTAYALLSDVVAVTRQRA